MQIKRNNKPSGVREIGLKNRRNTVNRYNRYAYHNLSFNTILT